MSDYGYQQQQQPQGGDSYGSDQGGYGGDQGGQGGQGGYGGDQGGYGGDQGGQTQDQGFGGSNNSTTDDSLGQDQSAEKKDGRREDEAGIGGLAAGGFAAYEGHEEKKDPEHAGRHKTEEELAGGGAVAAGGDALYERHEKKNEEGDVQDDSGEKKHSWL